MNFQIVNLNYKFLPLYVNWAKTVCLKLAPKKLNTPKLTLESNTNISGRKKNSSQNGWSGAYLKA
jgi:hypothetical protein